MNKLQEFAAPAGRLLIALMFFMSGLNKIFAYEGTQGYMEAMGVPGALLPLVILTEVLLGLAVIVGFKTRLAAFGLAGFSIVSAILFHANFSDQMQMAMFMKNVAISGGFLFLIAHGAGAWSLDNRLAKSA
jgi:putative oxidoreductase